MAYFMGIENGGTLSKAVVFDAEGKKIAGASRRIPLLKNEGGFCERDMEALWLENCAMIRETLSGSGLVDSTEICGVACTDYGKDQDVLGNQQKRRLHPDMDSILKG